MIVRTLAKLIALLNSNRRSVEIGAAVAFGLWMALVPATNLLFVALVLVVFLIKVNLGMAIVSGLAFTAIVPAFDPLLSRLGEAVLRARGLEPLFTTMANTPIIPWTRFNDTLVMGAFLGGALAFVPVTLLAVGLVYLYRRYIHAKIVNSKIVKAFLATPFAQKVTRALQGVRRVWPASV